MPGPTVSASMRARVASTSIHSSPSSRKSSTRSPRPRRRRARRSAGHHVKWRPANVSSSFSWCRSDVTCTCSAPPSATRSVELGERHRQPLGRDVHVRLVRPRTGERARTGTAGARDRRPAATRPVRSVRTCAAIAARRRTRRPARRARRCANPGRSRRRPARRAAPRAAKASIDGGRARRRCSIQSSTFVS